MTHGFEKKTAVSVSYGGFFVPGDSNRMRNRMRFRIRMRIRMRMRLHRRKKRESGEV